MHIPISQPDSSIDRNVENLHSTLTSGKRSYETLKMNRKFIVFFLLKSKTMTAKIVNE